MNSPISRHFFASFFALLFALLFAFQPTTASAATAQGIPAGPAVTLSMAGLYDLSTADAGATVTIAANGIGLTGMAGDLAVVINAGITVTLVNASITSGSASPITAGGPGCGIILAGGNSATATGAGNQHAGVNVPDTASLTIDGPGALTAIGGSWSAGIGGDHNQSNGPITIQNATVTASSSGYGGAGIGGGTAGIGGQITLINAAVTASGSSGGAGIGGGSGGAGSDIAITDSAVTATGSNSTSGGGGAGIGGGNYSQSGSNITITNSQINATGGAGNIGAGGGAGIGGGGSNGGGSGGNGNPITLDAASTVRAIGGNGGDDGSGNGGGGGAAIGGGGGGSGDSGVGGYSPGPGGMAGNITIGTPLAVGSAGGAGGASHNGGNGALAGRGGDGGMVGTSGADGTEVTLLVTGGNASVGGASVNLSGRPNTSYNDPVNGVSYPAVPAVSAPANAAINSGENTSFSVTGSGGTAPLAYQWQVSTDGGATWTDISGATAATLSLTNVPLADDGNQYRCVVDDSVWREAVSSAALLTVQAVADLGVSVTASSAAPAPGDTVTFTVVVTNNGPNLALPPTVICAVPNTITNVQYSVDNSATWSSWPPLGSIGVSVLPNVNDTDTILIEGTISPTAADGSSISVTCSVTSATPDPDSSNNSATPLPLLVTVPTVTGVSVSPPTASVVQGGTRQFSATVAGTNSPAQTVTWSVSGGHSGTSISTSGLLTVGASETASALTVTATSTVDTSKSGTATVTVTSSYTPPPPGPTGTYTGQWIQVNGSGVPTENNWGLSILMGFPSDPGYIFVPWFTYDSSGNPSWYVFQGNGKQWSGVDTITMDVVRYHGSPWGTLPYDNSVMGHDTVGTATLTFHSATSATFAYNVEGASRTVNLVPIDGLPMKPSSYTGQWFAPAEDNWGLSVLQGFQSNPDDVFVPWYIYDGSGKASWYVFENHIVGNVVTADVYRYTGPEWGTTWDNGKITNEKVGTAKLTFTSKTAAVFEYDVEGSSRSVDLVKIE